MQGIQFLTEEEGYFTVEATVIGSIACFLVLFVMVALCYFYDVGVTAAWLQENVAERTLSMEEEKEEESSEQLKKRMILSKLEKCEITEKNTKIVGKATIAVNFPIPMVRDWLGRSWNNQIAIQMEKGNAPEQIRKWMAWKKRG